MSLNVLLLVFWWPNSNTANCDVFSGVDTVELGSACLRGPYTAGVKRASAWLFSLGLMGCGSPANPPAPTSAQQSPASTGTAAGPSKAASEPKPPEVPPPPKREPEPPPPAVPASIGDPGQPVPTVPGVLPPLPEPSLAVVVTLEKIQVGEVTLALEAGVLPKPDTPPQAIADALLASEDPVAWVADAGVPAATLRTLSGVLPPERSRVLVMQTSKGQQGAVTLVGTVPGGVPYVRIASDGFHLAEQSDGKEYDLGPDKAGDTFNYVELRNKAKSFRTKHPDLSAIRLNVEEGVTVEVLARAISQIRGPKCSVEPRRCWLPDIAFGDGVETAKGVSPKLKPKLELSKPAGASDAPGTVEIGKAKVGKGVDASKVNAVLKRRAGFARMCYFAALADSPTLAGTMDLRLTLGKDGKVIEVGVPESSLDDEAVEACLTRGLGGLRFAAPTESPVAVDVSLTFKLR